MLLKSTSPGLEPGASVWWLPDPGSDYDFFATGTGMPGIFTLTMPSWARLVK
jgi:hypothetical protein